jgi:hypothetical protein
LIYKGVSKLFLLYIICLIFGQNGYAQKLIRQDTIRKAGNIHHFIGFPVILHSPELTWAFGAAGSYYFKFSHKDSLIRTSFVQALGIATLRQQLVLGFDATIFFPNEAYILRIHGSVSRFPDRFWGLGNNSLSEDKEKYSISQYYIFPQLLRNVYRKFYVGAAYESQNVFAFEYGNPGGESIFDTQNVAGRKGSFTSGLGCLLLWDNRNNAFSSSKGFYFQYYINQFSQVLGSKFNYLSQILDVRKFVELNRNSVFACQFLGNFNNGDVPVRSMANIGSSSIMRGYYEGRYTDKNLMAVQGEWRQHVYGRLGLVAFGGVGRVAGSFSEFSFSGLKPSYGSGVRLAIDKLEKLNARLDFGFGTQSHGVYLNLAEAF